MRHKTLALAALVALSCAESDLDVAKNFDLGRFQGHWYEIARIPTGYDSLCHDTVADYRLEGAGTLNVVHGCRLSSPTGTPYVMRATARVDDPSIPAKMSLQVGTYVGAYWVLDVSPDYAYTLVGHPSRTMLWVLSRSPSLDPRAWQHVLAVAEQQGFNTRMLQKTPQSSLGH